MWRGLCSSLVFVFIQLSFFLSLEREGLRGCLRDSSLVCLWHVFFFPTVVLICLHRREEKVCGWGGVAGFGTWFIYAMAQMLSPLDFYFWLCSTGGEKERVPDVRWTRCKNKTAGTSFLAPSLLLVFSRSVGLGAQRGERWSDSLPSLLS
jgi:hypothetical protein